MLAPICIPSKRDKWTENVDGLTCVVKPTDLTKLSPNARATISVFSKEDGTIDFSESINYNLR